MGDLAISTGLCLDSTWAGQNLTRDIQVTRAWFLVDRKTNDTMVTLRGNPSYRSDETTVMVQEDQAKEPWSLYVGLYTVVEGFEAPPECK